MHSTLEVKENVESEGLIWVSQPLRISGPPETVNEKLRRLYDLVEKIGIAVREAVDAVPNDFDIDVVVRFPQTSERYATVQVVGKKDGVVERARPREREA